MTRVQIGFEVMKGGKRLLRLTPIDEVVALSPEAEALIGLLFSALDARDTQPGDGEVDVPISSELLARMRRSIPVLGQFLPSSGSAFVRLRPGAAR